MSHVAYIAVGALLGITLIGLLIKAQISKRKMGGQSIDWAALEPHEVPLPPFLSPAPPVPRIPAAPADSAEPEPAADEYALQQAHG